MSTVLALASEGGVAIAGDKQASDDGTVTSRNVERVFQIEGSGVGAVGQPADVQRFRRELEAELRQIRLQTDDEVDIDKRARIAGRLADQSDVAAVIAGYDADGIARLREIRPDGGIFDQSTVALGDGAELAAGQLETVEPGLDIDALVTTVTEILGRVATRDVTTGDELEVWSLPHA
jgi:proteasome beta subunit